MNFQDPTYLSRGNERQRAAYRALWDLKLFEVLSEHTPVLTGTVPLAIDIPGSDLDICCYWNDRKNFIDRLQQFFAREKDFTIRPQQTGGYDTVIARFSYLSFPIEIFGQNRKVVDQESYRHLCIEWEILRTRNEDFRIKIVALKKAGLKTEPAFALLLGLEGDPYRALLDYVP